MAAGLGAAAIPARLRASNALALGAWQVTDISLEDYVAVKPKFAVYVPHTAGRYQKKRFRKAQCPIVERCGAMSGSGYGHCTAIDRVSQQRIEYC